MSRIFIENLPKNINENELKKRFSQKGEITDIQLKNAKRVAFIGYKTPEEANDAVQYFNKTFINSCKISVKPAQGFYIKKTILTTGADSEERSLEKSKPKLDLFENVKNDPEFQSFLEVQRNLDIGKGKQIWKDDAAGFLTSEITDNNAEDEEEDNEECEKASDKVVEQKCLSRQTFEHTVKLRGLPYKIKKRQLKDFFKPIKPKSLRLVPRVKGIAYVAFKDDKDLKQALVKHRGFIDGHRIEITQMNKTTNGLDERNKDDDVEKVKKKKWEEKESAEPIGDSGRIYVRNLCYTCTEQDLRELFERFGTLTELHLPIDSYTKKPKGFAFVTYVFPEHAVQAFNQLDKTDFQGRLLHLLPAHAKSDTYNGPPPDSEFPKSDFKKLKKDEKKKEANNSTNWNALFIRPNAVADIMSKKFNVNKRDLLTTSIKGDNVAVRMALGETQIVNEVRQFLIQHNVLLESFERGLDCPRSNTVILVKSLPAETQKDEISQLFEKFGLVKRVILPPYGVTAIVEMQEANEAKFAFKKLAYSNFKHHPLFLEWAPVDVFEGKGSSEVSIKTPEFDSQHPEANDDIIENNSVIFVKNLNFKTTEDDFKSHFSKIGSVHSAIIAKKKSPNGLLSMGYGFIQYYQNKCAREAIKQLQGSTLDDHQLEIKLSNRTINQSESRNRPVKESTLSQKQTGSTICVKNIPFEASLEEVRKLFSVYGQIKSVRMPRKLTGSSSFRGFGFVDFVSKEDAKRAFEVLSRSTHLYGRALVLEWAKEDSNSDELLNQEVKQVGAKMARYFGSTQSSSVKRLKKNDLVTELENSTLKSASHRGDDLEDDEE